MRIGANQCDIQINNTWTFILKIRMQIVREYVEFFYPTKSRS